MTTVRRYRLLAAACAALAVVATANAANHWLPGERWIDRRVRDVTCAVSLASGNHCYDVLRPASSSVSWALGAAAFVALGICLILVRDQPTVKFAAMILSATFCAMAIVMVVVRSGESGFQALGRDWGPTSADYLWALLALLSLMATVASTVRAPKLQSERPQAI
jgi:CTP:molybdopterin cytidylyltransferase MocA